MFSAIAIFELFGFVAFSSHGPHRKKDGARSVAERMMDARAFYPWFDETTRL